MVVNASQCLVGLNRPILILALHNMIGEPKFATAAIIWAT
jgi:hypothetical protein